MKAFAPFFIALLVSSTAASGAVWDSGGNGSLNGNYFLRMFTVDRDTLAVQSVSGTAVFNGSGGYQLNGQRQSGGQTSNITFTGTYSVAPNGTAILQSPLFPSDDSETLRGAVARGGVFIASGTEGGQRNVAVAIPVAASPSNSSLQGTYWLASLDMSGGNLNATRNSVFQVNANGQGSLGTVTVAGHDVAHQHQDLSQVSTGATYSFSAGIGTFNIPAPSGVSASDALFAGVKTFYISPDGAYFLGMTPNGSDIFFGFRTAAGQAGNQSFSGIYYSVAYDQDLTVPGSPFVDAFYGSANALGTGNSLWHMRYAPQDIDAYDVTFDLPTSIGSDGVYQETFFRYAFASGGDVFAAVGRSSNYTFQVGIRAAASATDPGGGTPGAPYILPAGVVNGATYSPITNGVAPGEVVTLFGRNLAPSDALAPLPFTGSLNGVQVRVNGRLAPVFAVSPTQVSAIIPSATTEALVQVQVVTNGVASNTITLRGVECSPGLFTVPPVGTGNGAILHADYSLVDQSHPARPGEIVLLYVGGLGAVTPPVQDGQPGSLTQLSNTNLQYQVYFGNNVSQAGRIDFAGIAPGWAGLYQINVQIPDTVETGAVYVTVAGNSCVTRQAAIPISQ